MSEESGHKQFHINIMSDAKSKEKVEKSSNQSETYILIANEQLSNRIRELETELYEVKQENETLTEENERMEKSLTYQRGLLHNFDEMNNVRSNLIKILNGYVSDYRINTTRVEETTKSIREFRFQLYYIYGFLSVLCTGIGLIDVTSLLLMITLLFTTYYGTLFIFNIDRNRLNLKKMFENNKESYVVLEKDVKSKQKDLADLENSNNHIGEFIDNI
jgi:hypothetical protein